MAQSGAAAAGRRDVAVTGSGDGKSCSRVRFAASAKPLPSAIPQFNIGNPEAASILESMYATSADAQWGRTGRTHSKP